MLGFVRRKKRRKKGKHKGRSVFGFTGFLSFLVLGLGLCLVWSLYTGFRAQNLEQEARFVRAKRQAISSTYEADGLVLRDEYVYVSPISGRFSTFVPEGTRVGAGTRIAEVKKEPEASALGREAARREGELAQEQMRVSLDLAELVRKLNQVRLTKQEEESRLREAGTGLLGFIRARLAREEIARLKEEEKKLLDLIEKENQMARVREESKAGEVSSALASLSHVYHVFYARNPGVVSYRLDGLETRLSPALVDQVNWESYAERVQEKGWALGDGDMVAAGMPVFRLVDNYRIWVAVFPRGGEIKGLPCASLNRVRLELPEIGQEVSGVLVRNLTSRNGPLIFSLESAVPELLNVRRSRVNLKVKLIEGSMIPREALVREGDKTLVYLGVLPGAQAREVKVIYQEGNQVIVEGLPPGTPVLANPWILW